MHLPLNEKRYLPDPDEPVDRWYQARNASNARTTVELIEALVPHPVDFVLDPFAGGGSSAYAARLMRLPFYGIESDPVLACVALAKARSDNRHAALLRQLSAVVSQADVGGVLETIRTRCPPHDVTAVSALAVVVALGAFQDRAVTPEAVAHELGSAESAIPFSRVVLGDAADPAAWDRLAIPPRSAVMYTSPPFDVTSPRLGAPEHIAKAATDVLRWEQNDSLDDRVIGPGSFLNTTSAMLNEALPRLRNATLIIEHEPDDRGLDATEAVTAAAERLSERVSGRQIIRCGAFSRRGELSLVVLDVREDLDVRNVQARPRSEGQ